MVVFTHGIIRCLHLNLSGVALFTTTWAILDLTSVRVFTLGAAGVTVSTLGVDRCFSVYTWS